jgi:hypothetical protein
MTSKDMRQLTEEETSTVSGGGSDLPPIIIDILTPSPTFPHLPASLD